MRLIEQVTGETFRFDPGVGRITGSASAEAAARAPAIRSSGFPTPLHRRRIESLKMGQTLFLDGDPGDDVFQIVSGTIRFVSVQLDGRRMIAGFAVGGEAFSISHRGHYLYTAEAASDCQLRRMTRRELAADGTRGFIVDRLEREAWALQGEMLLLLHKDSDESIGHFILRMAERLAPGMAEGTRFRLDLSRADIADYLGLTVETVCRGIRRLRTQGILLTEGPHLFAIRNLAALRRWAGDAESGI